jgi:hypothetical protein
LRRQILARNGLVAFKVKEWITPILEARQERRGWRQAVMLRERWKEIPRYL